MSRLFGPARFKPAPPGQVKLVWPDPPTMGRIAECHPRLPRRLGRGIELGRISVQPARPLAHALMGAGDEAALYVAEAADHDRARAEMIGVLDQLIAGVTT